MSVGHFYQLLCDRVGRGVCPNRWKAGACVIGTEGELNIFCSHCELSIMNRHWNEVTLRLHHINSNQSHQSTHSLSSHWAVEVRERVFNLHL